MIALSSYKALLIWVENRRLRFYGPGFGLMGILIRDHGIYVAM